MSRRLEFAARLPPWVQRIAPLLAIPLLVLLFFNKMAFSNLILARGDTFLYFYPYWDAAAAALRSGRVPLWNPDLFMGAPFLANSQVGVFYPLNWPVWLLFDAPVAVKVSILLHLTIAGWGAYLAARRTLDLARDGALVTAVAFALGGYLTAQVEHVNQLQGLAWLPWVLVVLARCSRARPLPRYVAIGQTVTALAGLFALQLLAGHTQTTFITGAAALLWGGGLWLSAFVTRRAADGLPLRFDAQRFWQRFPLALLLGAGLAGMLTAVQLLPTQELAQLSTRQGGLPVNEVLSFSLHPLLLPRALLPGYGQTLFSEYVAFLPLTLLLLACLGGWQWRTRRGVLPALILTVAGLLLALGLFNPLNWLLARVPGFNLFRVPARWLVLYALGASLLAGAGWQAARTLVQQRRHNAAAGAPWAGILSFEARPVRLGAALLLGLMAFSLLATLLARWLPTGPEAPYEPPTAATGLLWLLELLAAVWVLADGRWPRRRPDAWLLVGSLLLLFAASRSQPYHQLTTPEAYADLRPPVARLLAAQRAPDAPVVPGRFLSLSDIFFDPGDQAELDAIYVPQLDAAARYDYTIAIKQKEIIAPNLPLTYGLPAVDGFDGGVLPLRAYSEVTRLLLPPGVRTRDGRLRELVSEVPPPAWLDLFNVQYLITDKTGDAWRNEADGLPFALFFDRQHPVTVNAGETITVGAVPAFAATAVYILSVDGDVGQVATTLAGDVRWTVDGVGAAADVRRFPWPVTDPTMPETVSLVNSSTVPWRVAAVTLVNERDGTFMPVVPGQYRLIHSGDVKIYENLDVLPRARLLFDWVWMPDAAAAVAALQRPGFDAAKTAVLSGEPGPAAGQRPVPGTGTATVTAYAPERVVVQTDSSAPALLLLADATYPGWETAVDGEPAPLLTANGLFRAVFVPPGSHEVVYEFAPGSFEIGRWISLAGLLLWLLLGGLLRLWRE